MNHMRVILAFLIAPLMTPVSFMTFDLVRGRLLSLSETSSYFVTFGPYAYVATAVFGIPTFFLFRTVRWTNAILFVTAGG
jgi:hypothetical protein